MSDIQIMREKASIVKKVSWLPATWEGNMEEQLLLKVENQRPMIAIHHTVYLSSEKNGKTLTYYLNSPLPRK